MKRSEALTPLSRDHHGVLLLAKNLREATEVEPAAAAFIEFWQPGGINHFRIEEEVLLPGSNLPGPGEDGLSARMLHDHLDIRRRASTVLAGDATLSDIHVLGALLHDHTRFEERELFLAIETNLSPEELDRLGEQIAFAMTTS
ncbi:MAG: hemerythrin domain-containing protein [Thermoleophilia bacterium]|nr:hemerythrin domain-containing protein [Thermoleophilia bacterium]